MANNRGDNGLDAGNDPINRSDPSGHAYPDVESASEFAVGAVRGSFADTGYELANQRESPKVQLAMDLDDDDPLEWSKQILEGGVIPSLSGRASGRFDTRTPIQKQAATPTASGSYTFVARTAGGQTIRTVSVGNVRIEIKSSHGYDRTHATGSVSKLGISRDRVESAIVDDIINFQRGATLPSARNSIDRVINVDSHSIGYTVGVISPGQIGVGTYYPK